MKKQHILLAFFAVFAIIVLSSFSSPVSAQTYYFGFNLSVGSRGTDVVNLQTVLMSKGFDIPAISSGISGKGYFGTQTQNAVARYQASVGVPNTGFVGPLTRARLNGTVLPPPGNTPIISAIDAPTTLSVGQMGQWSVHASDPQNGTLSYQISWGDEPQYVVNAGMSAPVGSFVQTTVFTHTYAYRGVYTVRVTVRNASGLTAQTSASVNVTDATVSPSLKVISPNGAETWTKGTTQNIIWQDNPSVTPCPVGAACMQIAQRYYDISLMRYYPPCTTNICPLLAIAPYTIAKSVTGSTYSWFVGQVVPTGTTPEGSTNNTAPDGIYTVQICEVISGRCDSSDTAFTVTSQISTVPDINIISPNGGETWLVGSPLTITVNVSGSEQNVVRTVNAYLVDQNNRQTLLATKNIQYTGIQNIGVAPMGLFSGEGTYRLYVTLFSGATMQAYDYSDSYFNITRTPCPAGYVCTSI